MSLNFFLPYFVGDPELSDIPLRIREPEGSLASLKLIDIENRHIVKVLKMYGGNKKRTSEILGITENTLTKRIRDYGLGV